MRAITHAAFNFGLLRLCAHDERPFPGVVLLDSPLVVYREPDRDEESFPVRVKDAFYLSIAEEFRDSQVIILENDEPPESVHAVANVELFTARETGRRGFIPRT